MAGRAMTLALGPYQAVRLARYLAAYRAYAWREVPPSPQRNQALRAAQGMQGRVVAWRGEEQQTLLLSLSEEEKQVMSLVLATLTQAPQVAFPPPERAYALNEIAAFRLLLAQRGQAVQASPTVQEERA